MARNRRYSTNRVGRIICLWRDKRGQWWVLLVLSKKRGAWEFPGGKLARGETYEKAAAREFTEETGGRVTDLHRFAIWRHDVVSVDGQKTTRTIKHYFIARAPRQYPGTIGDDVLDVSWVRLDDALWIKSIKEETRTILELVQQNPRIRQSFTILQTTRFDKP